MSGSKKNGIKNMLGALPGLTILVGLGCLVYDEATERSSKTAVAKPVTELQSIVRVQQGNLAMSGGSPTVRKSFVQQPDDPLTTNDESNDQPVGHFGTATLSVHSVESGNTYTLDAEISGGEVERIYFPKGGWVDLVESEIDSTGNGSGTDEQGRHWDFEGFDGGTLSMNTEEESDESEEAEE
ncbi:MAG: hypothetical protein K2Y39_20095 [Candidatus Obscuribacterales bacterium]|nr:hypothetical protein [Candidatus Obscuribacterales bacterium]